MARTTSSLAFVLFAASLLGTFAVHSDASAPATGLREAAVRPETLGHLPLPCDFEENRGQTAAGVDYLARCAGYVAFLSKGDAVIRTERDAFRVHVVGGSASSAVPSQTRPGRSHYLLGNDAARWTRQVPHYGRVAYDEVLQGIGIEYRTQGRALGFDVTVAPGAAPSSVRVRLDGVRWAGPDAGGSLSIGLASGGAARLSAPRAWQEVGGERRGVDVAFAQGEGRDEFGFRVGVYDSALPLVIDPVLTVSTYLGGARLDNANAIAVDPNGAIYLTGLAASSDFPTTTGALQTAKGDASTTAYDAYVTKLDASGSHLVWSTYLGGTGSDIANGIAVDASGNAHVGGITSSSNFPTVSAYDTEQHAGFVAKLNSTGTALTWSTYFPNVPDSVGLDSSGNVYCLENSGRAFSFDSSGSVLRYSVQTNGGSNEFSQFAMAVDPSGVVWLGGRTSVGGFATQGAYSNTYAGGQNDGFIMKLATNGNVAYRSYFGGDGNDVIRAMTLDAAGNLIVAGTTTSTNLPLAGATQTSIAGATDTFVAKFNPSVSSLVFSTYLGGSADDAVRDVATNSSGDVFLVGETNSADFPTHDAFQSSLGGGYDVSLAEFTSTGTLTRSTYLGGAGADYPTGVAAGAQGTPLIAGETRSSDFPLACAMSLSLGGTADAFLAGVASGSATFPDLSKVTLPGATVGRPYSRQLTIAGGTAPLTWTLQQGPTPQGLLLSSTGLLAGTPTTAGASQLFVRIDDSASACAVREFDLVVNAVPEVPTSTLPAWTVDRPYSQAIPVVGGTPPFTWTLDSGATPPGTSVTAEGVLYGTPSAEGDYTLDVSLVDANGAAASGMTAVHINASPSITTQTLPAWTQNRPYASAVEAAQGTAPFTWAIESGELPIDAGIDPETGALAGTTLAPGDYVFTVAATDAAGAVATREFTVRVNPWPSFPDATIPFAVLGRPYEAAPRTAGGTTPFAWTITSGTFPPGFAGFDGATGQVLGTPSAIARELMTFQLTDAAGAVVSAPFALVVVPLADLGKGKYRQKIAISAEQSTRDVVRCVEALAGTTMDIKLKVKSATESAVDLLLLDPKETPVDLGAYRTVKPNSVTVKDYLVPATGRWFVVVRPTPGFEGSVSLQIAVKAPGSRKGATTFDDAGEPVEIPFSALPGSKLVVATKSAKESGAVPTITSLKDADGNELLVPAELRTTRKGATLKVRERLLGGDYVVTFAPGNATPGDVFWSIGVSSPRGYHFELTDLPVTTR